MLYSALDIVQMVIGGDFNIQPDGALLNAAPLLKSCSVVMLVAF